MINLKLYSELIQNAQRQPITLTFCPLGFIKLFEDMAIMPEPSLGTQNGRDSSYQRLLDPMEPSRQRLSTSASDRFDDLPYENFTTIGLLN